MYFCSFQIQSKRLLRKLPYPKSLSQFFLSFVKIPKSQKCGPPMNFYVLRRTERTKKSIAKTYS